MKTKTIKFKFVIKHYVPYRFRFTDFDRYEWGIDGEPKVVHGTKSAKLFSSWFRLMKNKKRLLFGTAEIIETGEKFSWDVKTGWYKKLF